MREFADRMYLHAKIHGLHHTILSGPSYREVLTTRTFNSFNMGPPSNSENTSSLYDIEEQLFRKQIETVLNLMNISGYYRRLFNAYLHIFETWNVKALLVRADGRYTGDMPWFDISPFDLVPSSFRKKKADRARLFSLLPERYTGVLRNVSSSERYEHLEVALDMAIYNELAESMRYLHHRDAVILAGSLLLNITLLAITWQKRLTVLYRWNAKNAQSFVNEMAGDLMHSHHLLRKRYPDSLEYWKKLVPLSGAELHHGDYAELRKMEHSMHRRLYNEYRSWFFRDFHASWCVVSFIWLVYYQLQNLRGIVEGLRAKMHPDGIYSLLVCEG